MAHTLLWFYLTYEWSLLYLLHHGVEMLSLHMQNALSTEVGKRESGTVAVLRKRSKAMLDSHMSCQSALKLIGTTH